MASPPDLNTGSGFKIKSGSKYFNPLGSLLTLNAALPVGGLSMLHNHNSTLSTSKFLTTSAHVETKGTFKTSYFGCLSNSSKKSIKKLAHHLHHRGHLLHSRGSGGMGLDISPILGKSVSCFDPIIGGGGPAAEPAASFPSAFLQPETSAAPDQLQPVIIKPKP